MRNGQPIQRIEGGYDGADDPVTPPSRLVRMVLFGLFAALVQFAAPIGHVVWAPASEHGPADLSPCLSTAAAEAHHDRSPCPVCKTLSSARTAALPAGFVALDATPPGASNPLEETTPFLRTDLSGRSSRAPPTLS